MRLESQILRADYRSSQIASPVCFVCHIAPLGRTLSLELFQSRQRPSARAKLLSFDSKALEHVDVKIAQRRRVVDIERQVLTMLEATASDQDWKVLGGVAAAIAKVTTEEDCGAIEQAVALFL